jgi:hypothetical protein
VYKCFIWIKTENGATVIALAFSCVENREILAVCNRRILDLGTVHQERVRQLSRARVVEGRNDLP